jgi:hypothetical protein
MVFFSSFQPHECLYCLSHRFHKHASYGRILLTLFREKLRTVILRNRRWRCVICGHTTSVTPPHLIKRAHACTLVHFLIMWTYLNSPQGFEKCDFGDLEEPVARSTLFRYLKRARKNALFTLQIFREVVFERIEPEAWESLTLEGLSPPEYSKLEIPEVCLLWEAFSILIRGTSYVDSPLSLLLARARERAVPFKKTVPF